jgi:predicted metal-dependent phosphoesterase TrpH
VSKADLHIHTAYGDGMADIPELLDYVEGETDLSVIAVTEHDDLKGGLAAREEWARGRFRFQVVVGEEVTALEGHLLALFMEEPVPSLKPLAQTLEAVHRQGGLCIIPHPMIPQPMNWFTRSIGQSTIERVMQKRGSGAYFDAIEAANPTPGARSGQEKARRLNQERYRLPEVGGSDAHFLPVVGRAYTLFEGESAEELRRGILEGTTSAVNGRYPSLSEIGYGRFLRQQWRGIMVTPRTVGWLPTISSLIKRFKR